MQRGCKRRSMGILLDVDKIRKQFLFPRAGRIVTNNAASTQPPTRLLEMFRSLGSVYENVHRGQSAASREMTGYFESSYDTIADFLNAPSRRNIILYRNATEAINAVMYSLLTEFRDGDNVVTTRMEHNSNYVPWYGLCHEILPRLGKTVECRIVDFDRGSGELDLNQMADLVDSHTKLVCCTGASNFLGTKNPISRVRSIAGGSGYMQPNGERRSYLLVDGAQLVPSTYVDVREMDVDFLAFSFHKILAPFGIGVLYAREEILGSLLPFLYGGDMIAEGQVSPEYVGYNDLPWKYAAGTPNILGAVVSAQALRMLLDLALNPGRDVYFHTERKLDREVVRGAMNRIALYTRQLTRHAREGIAAIPGVTVYGPPVEVERTPLVAFNVRGRDPMKLAELLDFQGVESRAGCHCATLAHHYLHLNPPASCRLSFYFYNTPEEVRIAVRALERIVSGEVTGGGGGEDVPYWISSGTPMYT